MADFSLELQERDKGLNPHFGGEVSEGEKEKKKRMVMGGG